MTPVFVFSPLAQLSPPPLPPLQHRRGLSRSGPEAVDDLVGANPSHRGLAGLVVRAKLLCVCLCVFLFYCFFVQWQTNLPLHAATISVTPDSEPGSLMSA